jgi:hypothetical protein
MTDTPTPTPAGAPAPIPAPATSAATPAQPPAAEAGTWQELALRELSERRAALEHEIGELETRREAIRSEIAGSFAGQADSVARRLKGFQDYLVGALQDLAVAAEQIELVPQPLLVQPSPQDAAPAPPPPPHPPPPPPRRTARRLPRVCSPPMPS